MDEATKKALNEFVQQMITAAQTGAQWTADQAPLLVQEWLRWQLVSSILYAMVLILIGAVLLYATVKMIRGGKDKDYYMPGPLFTGIGAVFVFVPAFGHIMQAVKVYVAPRVVVIEQFIHLVRW